MARGTDAEVEQGGFITDFPDGTDSTDCSVRAHDSTPNEPGRSFFVKNLGNDSRRNLTGVPSKRSSSGLVEDGGIRAEEQISVISIIREIRDETALLYLRVRPCAVFLLVRAGGARAAARRKQIFHSRFSRRPPHFTETPGQPLGTEINRRLGRPMSSVVPVDLLRIAGRVVQAFRLLRPD